MNGASIATAGIVGGTSLLRVWQNTNADRPVQSFRIIAGTFLLGACMSAIAMGSPGIANGLAVLIIFSTVLLNINAINKALGAVTSLGK